MELLIKAWLPAVHPIPPTLAQIMSSYKEISVYLSICWEDTFKLCFDKNFSKWFLLTTRTALNFMCLFIQDQVNLFTESTGWKTALVVGLESRSHMKEFIYMFCIRGPPLYLQT